jgi:hypothetical protein
MLRPPTLKPPGEKIWESKSTASESWYGEQKAKYDIFQ